MLSLLALAGCTTATKEAVYINWDAVAVALRPVEFARPTLDLQSSPSKTESLEVPSLPGGVASTSTSKERLAQARATIAANFKAALKQLTDGLLEAYLHDIDRFEKEKLATLEPDRDQALGKLFKSLSESFRAYARKRGPLVAELAFLVGFPDPDPGSTRQSESERRIDKERDARSKTLRSQIADLDKAYIGLSQKMVDDADAQYESEIEAVQQLIETMRDAADLRAQQEARNLLKSDLSLQSVLEDTSALTLKPVPGKKVTIQPVEPLAAPKRVPFATREDIREQLLRDARIDAQIWADTRYYILDRGRRGRDATAEFLEWRRERL